MKHRLAFRWIGISLTAIGTVLLLSWNTILNFFINRELSLSPTSTLYELWKKPPVPVTMNVYLFNCTNPDQLLEKNYKPEFVQMGPYRFNEVDEKVNITWNPNHTVTYRQVKRWYFDHANSNGSLNDIVTMLNVVPVGASYVTRYWHDLFTYPVSGALLIFEKNIWVTKPVSELLFDGYTEPLLSMASRVPGLISFHVPMDRVGFFYGRNGSALYDGVFNVETGTDDFTKRGIIRNWNYKNFTPYEGVCQQVRGSTGEFFPPVQTKNTTLEVFMYDICRILQFEYLDDVTVHGIAGYRYGIVKNFVVNGTVDKCEEQALPQGVMNVSACLYGAPAFVSSPHFFQADPYYLSQVSGLQPEADKHHFYVTLEPTTGTPIDVTARMQMNLLLQPNSRLRMFAQVPEILFPMIWVEIQATLTPQLATSFRIYLQLPTLSVICSVGLLLTGLLTLGLTFLHQSARAVSKDNHLSRRNRLEDSGTGEDEAEKQTPSEENSTLLHT